jgi:hypothetical protein
LLNQIICHDIERLLAYKIQQLKWTAYGGIAFKQEKKREKNSPKRDFFPMNKMKEKQLTLELIIIHCCQET